MSNFFTWSVKDIISALVSGVLMALVVMGSYVIHVGSIFDIDWRTLADIGTISLITTTVSLVKSLLTTSTGKFAGAVSIK